MNALNTASVSLAVTPTVVSTLVSHYFNRKPRQERPTAHLSYDEGLHLIRSFLEYAAQHTVEELQSFTSQWVPHPQWVKIEEVTIPDDKLAESARLLQDELGQEGIRKVGGRTWWQWRKPSVPLKAEWIEMRSDYNERKRTGDPGKRVMLYVHGGAYFFGSVDEHRYQLQRHARKLKARVLAPNYRLAPQFPFPCGLHDCLAAYLYLLTVQEPETIILAGDSAGGGMVLAMLCLLRNQGIPLPAGAVLISPWVDLTHSFPSVAEDNPFDYIPASGFHHKPSMAWPPPNDDDMAAIREQVAKKKTGAQKGPPQTKNTLVETGPAEDGPAAGDGSIVDSLPRHLSLMINEIDTVVKDQIQIYTTNELLSHPLVSPVMQPTLGGLPPILVMVGGGELLRDEQMYLAHKCAHPAKYAQPEELLTERGKAQLKQYKPTDVQLQVWDDLCHVAPTLSFTRPAKYMYRSIAQFGAWALARAQKTGIDILDDDAISFISSSGSENGEAEASGSTAAHTDEEKDATLVDGKAPERTVGKAGDPLPPFKDNMIRQRVTRHGAVFPLAPAEDLPACIMKHAEVGIIKEGPVKKWLETKKRWETRFAGTKAKVHKKIVKDMVTGYLDFGENETPPPSALAGRRVPSEVAERKKTKSIGLALWGLWGSKHDEMTVGREERADRLPIRRTATADEGQGARAFQEIRDQDLGPLKGRGVRSRSRRRTVVDEYQTGREAAEDDTAVAELLRLRREREEAAASNALLTPGYVPETGVAGKRPMLGGVALPFSLGREADTASMLTLTSEFRADSRPISPVPPANGRDSIVAPIETQDSGVGLEEDGAGPAKGDGIAAPFETQDSGVSLEKDGVEPAKAEGVPSGATEGAAVASSAERPPLETFVTAALLTERPALETFVTAAEDLPKAK